MLNGSPSSRPAVGGSCCVENRPVQVGTRITDARQGPRPKDPENRIGDNVRRVSRPNERCCKTHQLPLVPSVDLAVVLGLHAPLDVPRPPFG